MAGPPWLVLLSQLSLYVDKKSQIAKLMLPPHSNICLEAYQENNML